MSLLTNDTENKNMSNAAPTTAHIEAKRVAVRAAYDLTGDVNPTYEREFDELHDMNLAHKANNYRAKWGLGPDAHTPFSTREV